MKYSKLVVLTCLFASQALTFWQQGHLFVARIAYDILSKEAPDALAAANKMLDVYAKSEPSMVNLEGDYPFVECATFADEIKSKGGTWQSGWHFIDTPYLDEGGDAKDYPGFVFDDENIGKVIPDIQNWLMGTGDYKSSFVYTTMTSKIQGEDNAKSFALRLLIHYIGDIHQPLHATSRVDSKYPKGDAGGNFFHVPQKGDVKNLHSVWDSVVYLFQDTPSLPYNDNDWSDMGNTVSTMSSKYNFDPSEYQNTDVDHWADESYVLSSTHVYEGITENKPLSQDYITHNQDHIQSQIVIGGYRLAYMIKTIFGNNQVNKSTDFLQ